MKRATTASLVLALGVSVTALGGGPATAAMVKSWALPFPGSAPFHVAAGGDVIHYVDFDGSSGVTYLGYLDIARRKVREMRIPYATGTGQELKVRPQDGAVFVNDPDLGELAIGDVRNRMLRRWPLPPGSGARSFTFDDQGRVLFLASSYATPRVWGVWTRRRTCSRRGSCPHRWRRSATTLPGRSCAPRTAASSST